MADVRRTGQQRDLVETVAVQRVENPDEVRQVLQRLGQQATRQLCSALPGSPRVDYLRSSWSDDIGVLRRGVEVKELVTPQAINTPAGLGYFTELAEQGAQLRMSHRVLQRVFLVDRKVAVVPAAVDARGGAALVVREPAMLLSLYQQFDSIWRNSVPIGNGPADVLQVEGVTEVLKLLAQGLTDDAIARRLQVSHRTVQRRVGAVMEMLGASSRFSAGAAAQEMGWL